MPAEVITFVVPHQRQASGGVYVIENLARELARTTNVTLAVRKGPLRAIDGVRTVAAPDLAPGELPPADIIVGGLGQPDPDRLWALPPRCGRAVFLFQGFGTPGNPAVLRALAERPPVLALSAWLEAEARRHGCPTARYTTGLDRAIFHPGSPCADRGPVVSMMTHETDWKGTDDGLAALAAVRRRLPGVDLRFFGGLDPGTGTYLPELRQRRDLIAELMRESAVVVCPSWEEGLGLPGVEALACGAALATTDTKGSREYAHHEETALVSPPRRPDELAENIIRLLEDCTLRQRLAIGGTTLVEADYPSWPEGAERFRAALEMVLARRRRPARTAGVRRPDPPPASPPGWSTGPPDFVGVGAQRAGTTRWFDLVCAHPLVTPTPATRKELHYFGRFHDGSFTPADADAYADYFPRPHGQLSGEWTPNYMASFWIPPLLAASAPEARLLVMLRDPVTRYLSGLQRHHRIALSAETSLSALAPYEAFMRGLYEGQLRRLYEHYDRSRVLVLQYEGCVADPEGELDRTFGFLGLPPVEIAIARTHHPNEQRTKPRLHPPARSALIQAYRPEVGRLAELCPEIDLGLWPNFADMAR